MHITNSICGDCKHFEHECFDEFCGERCTHPKARTREYFWDADDYIEKCGDFED